MKKQAENYIVKSQIEISERKVHESLDWKNTNFYTLAASYKKDEGCRVTIEVMPENQLEYCE